MTAKTPPAPPSKLSVMVVEDEALIGLHLTLALEEWGFRVVGPFPSAAEAGRAAARTPPDAAIVDLNLTDGPRGLALAEHLASLYGTRVIMATANPERVAVGNGGVSALLRKPYTDHEIEAALRSVLRDRARCPSPETCRSG